MSKIRKRKHGKPNRFQHLEVSRKAVSEEEVGEAIRTFIMQFVSVEKRARASLFLLQPTKRSQGIGDLFSWLDQSVVSILKGSEGFPQHLEERFGALCGILVMRQECTRVTVAEAASLHDDSVFMSDDGSFAILFYDVGEPTLCLTQNSHR